MKTSHVRISPGGRARNDGGVGGGGGVALLNYVHCPFRALFIRVRFLSPATSTDRNNAVTSTRVLDFSRKRKTNKTYRYITLLYYFHPPHAVRGWPLSAATSYPDATLNKASSSSSSSPPNPRAGRHADSRAFSQYVFTDNSERQTFRKIRAK